MTHLLVGNACQRKFFKPFDAIGGRRVDKYAVKMNVEGRYYAAHLPADDLIDARQYFMQRLYDQHHLDGYVMNTSVLADAELFSTNLLESSGVFQLRLDPLNIDCPENPDFGIHNWMSHFSAVGRGEFSYWLMTCSECDAMEVSEEPVPDFADVGIPNRWRKCFRVQRYEHRGENGAFERWIYYLTNNTKDTHKLAHAFFESRRKEYDGAFEASENSPLVRVELG